MTERRGLADHALAVFARSASPGKAKTRLIPLLGPRGAAGLHAALVYDAARKVDKLPRNIMRYFFLAGPKPLFLPPGVVLARQRGADLGARLENAFRLLLRTYKSAVVIGTDSPLLPTRTLRAAFGELRICDAVLGPCPDGGYYLIGLRRFPRGLLRNVRWGTRFAFRDTLQSLVARGQSCSILEEYADVDVPADVRRVQRELKRSRTSRNLAPETWKFLTSFEESLKKIVGRRSARMLRGQ